VKGFFNAILHAAVMLTPIVGQVISDLILKGRSSLPIGEFSIERFQEEAA
jgi:glycine/D-amino acid oxidase-like deaminating enzyme